MFRVRLLKQFIIDVVAIAGLMLLRLILQAAWPWFFPGWPRAVARLATIFRGTFSLLLGFFLLGLLLGLINFGLPWWCRIGVVSFGLAIWHQLTVWEVGLLCYYGGCAEPHWNAADTTTWASAPVGFSRVCGRSTGWREPSTTTHLRWPLWLEQAHAWPLITLLTRLPGFMPARSGQELRDTVRRAYHEITTTLGPWVRGPIHAMVFSHIWRPATGDVWVWRPAGPVQGVLVALHGHGGSSWLALDAWRPFVAAQNWALVLPTFGYGAWEHPAAIDYIDQIGCWLNCISSAGSKPEPRVLAGLSQGGAGVCQCGWNQTWSARWLISPTVIQAPFVASDENPGPVYIAVGTKDLQVSLASVRALQKTLESQGRSIHVEWLENEDHSVMLRMPERLQTIISLWQRAVLESWPPAPNTQSL